MNQRSLRRTLAAGFAILGPLAVVGAVTWALLLPEAPEEQVLGAGARRLEERIRGGADVVILGNSKVGSDLDPDAIGSLFPGEARVVPMHVKGTGMPVWYSVLRERVVANDVEPRLVIVYGTLMMMAQSKLPTAAQRAQLAEQATSPDPVLDTKVYGAAFADPRAQLALRRRGEWQRALTDGARDLAVGLFAAPPGEGSLFARGRATALPALAEVFDGDAKQRGTVRRVIPVVDAEVADASEANGVGQTLIPDLVALAYAHGAQVLFVRCPLPPDQASADTVPAELEADIYAWLEAAGAGWVDLRDAPLAPGLYGGVHLSRAGRAAFTPTVLAALSAVGVGTDRLVPAEPPRPRVPVEAVREGALPVLPELAVRKMPRPCTRQARFEAFLPLSDSQLREAGFGEVSPVQVFQDEQALTPHARRSSEPCAGNSTFADKFLRISPTSEAAGDAATFRAALIPEVPARSALGEEIWWVYPGTAVRVTVPAGAVAGPRRLRVVAAAPLPGSSSASVQLDGAAPVAFVPAGKTVEAIVEGPAAAGDWSFTVRSPAAGPWLLLRRVVTGAAEAPIFLVGGADTPVMVDLLREVAFAAPPPPLPTPEGAPVASRTAGLFTWDVRDLHVPSFGESFEAAGMGCTPVEVLAGGELLAARRGEDGKPLVRVTHPGGTLKFGVGEGGAMPAEPLSLRLAEDRRCRDEGRWLYPGDVATFTVSVDALGAFARGATQLGFGATAFPSTANGGLTIRVARGERVVLEENVALSSFPIPSLSLPEPILAGEGPVTVTLTLDDPDAYVLLTSAALTEPARLPLGEVGP